MSKSMRKKEDTILMIASGMKRKKKEFMKYNANNVYLNYGLLGLATILYNKGYVGVRMFQGDDKSTENLIEDIYNEGIEINSLTYPVFISIPSFFAITWAEEFISEIKKIKKDIKVIVGGRWTVDNNLEWIKQRLPLVDFVCRGCPDEYIEDILEPSNWEKYVEPGEAKSAFENFNYELLFQYKKYQPSIEICRGCGNGCAFCLEGKYRLTKRKSALSVIKEAESVCKLYEDDHLNFYFEASIFNPTLEWAKEFKKYYDEYGMKFKWRFETRVDVINLEVLDILAGAGLKVIDLGLESASPRQLERMEKTKDAEKYLKKAEALLDKAFDCDIWCKLNILLYVGETKETLNETLEWLGGKKYKGLSVNPFILYLNGEGIIGFIDKIKEIAQIEVDEEELNEKGYLFIDLSNEITSDEAKKISRDIEEKYMSREDYMDLKRICYMERKN